MIKLFLDDIRMPKDVLNYWAQPIYSDPSWVIVRSFDEFTKYFTDGNPWPEIISYDHDLADEHYYKVGDPDFVYEQFTEKTGYHCVEWLCDYCVENKKTFPSYFIHSQNHIGAKNIQTYIQNFFKYMT